MKLRRRSLTLRDRARLYSKAFPKWPPLVVDDRWISGVWILGNDYRNTTRYYGAYPPSFLKRINAIFPDKQKVLHLFSGSLPKSKDYIRFDSNKRLRPDLVGDAQKLSWYFPANGFDLIYADPPYSKEDAVKYGTKLPNRKQVLHECYKVLRPGGHLVWLDTVLPMFTKREFHWCGAISVIRSTNHRVRGCFIFQKYDHKRMSGSESSDCPV